MVQHHVCALAAPTGQSSYNVRALFTAYNITAQVRRAFRASGAPRFRLAAMLGNGPCSICDPQRAHMTGGKLGGYCTPGPANLRCTDYVARSPSDATCCKKGVQNGKAFRAIVSLKLCARKPATVARCTDHLVTTRGGGAEQVDVAEWRELSGPVLRDDLYTGEVFDARRNLGPYY